MECSCILEIVGDIVLIKNFKPFHEFVSLKLLSPTETRFSSAIVMLKRFKLINQSLLSMVISDKWSCYRDDDVRYRIQIRYVIRNTSFFKKIGYDTSEIRLIIFIYFFIIHK